MEFLTASSCLKHLSSATLPLLTIRPVRSAQRGAKFSIRVTALHQTRIVLRGGTFSARPLSVKAEFPPVDLRQETLFNEVLDQTIYVEKDTSVVENEVSTTPLRLAEIIPEPANHSLVREKAPHKAHRSIILEVLAISLPALGTLVADPLMSLVDTAAVGQISAVQLAALGPNTAIFNMISSIFSFMAAALATRLAGNSAKAPGLSHQEATARRAQNETILSHSLILALGLGAAVTGFLYTMGPTLLRCMGASPSLMAPSLGYLYIRALAAPAVLFMSVAQGACLGQQDMWTPMRVMITAGVVNLLGDVALIHFVGLGTVGAAAATAVSQIAGAIYFYTYLRKGGGNKGSAIKLKWKGLPTLPSLMPIIAKGRVLVVRSVVLMMAYTGMTTAAAAMGTEILAAHQVILQVFWFLATLIEPFCLTAQSLLARDRQDPAKVRDVAAVVMKFAAVAGMAFGAILTATLSFTPHWFTTDLAVIRAFQSVIPHAVLALLLFSVSITYEGVCIGLDRIKNLPKVVFVATGCSLSSLWVTQTLNLGLSGVWTAAVVFFLSRGLLHVSHLIKHKAWMPLGFLAKSCSLDQQSVHFATT